MAVAHKYLKEEVLKDRKGNNIVIPVPAPSAGEGEIKFVQKELTSSLFAYLTMEAYVPMQGFVLKQAEMRHYDSTLNKLEKDLPISGYWDFEEPEFTVLKQCIDNIAPLVPLLAKHQVAMDNMMKAVLNELPVQAGESS